MDFLKFISKSLVFFRKQQFALLAGTILSTALITGSLIIGDSVKKSLKDIVNFRLGNARFALITGERFVTANLAQRLEKDLGSETASLLQIPAIAINPESGIRVNSAQVIGIDNDFNTIAPDSLPEISGQEAFISDNLAQKLKLEPGQEFLLRIENISLVPLNAPFSNQEQPSISLRLKIKSIVGKHQMGWFSLKNDQKPPFNIFVQRSLIDKELKISGLINIILLCENSKERLSEEKLQQSLKASWQMKDAGLGFKKTENEFDFDLVSDRIFIDNEVVDLIDSSGLKYQPVLTYLVNSIKAGIKNTPYSFITALRDHDLVKGLKENEIVINEWLADDLGVKTGDTLTLEFFVIGPFRTLKENRAPFIIHKIIPVQKLSSMMPDFQGLTEAGHCRDWKAGVPIDFDRIRDKDEDYWNKYRGTPKAFISIESGSKIWNNKIGELSAMRFNISKTDSNSIKKEILQKLNPKDLGLAFYPVFNQGLAATVNAVDFSQLFLSLGFFVILAAVILTMLIHSLNMESRSVETGILMALGFNPSTIFKIRLSESMIIIILGSIIGSLVGILYNFALLSGLNTVWNDAVHTNMIEVYINPLTLLYGTLSGIVISLVPVVFITWKNLTQNITSLVKNNVYDNLKPLTGNIRKQKLILLAGILLFILGMAYASKANEALKPLIFMALGGLLLGLFLYGLNYLFNAFSFSFVKLESINHLALKNLAKYKKRNLATIALLALGVFVIIITAANKKNINGDEDKNESGTGGFLYWAETRLPVIHNLNTPEGKLETGLDPNAFPREIEFFQFHSLSGDDASCLNLNQVQNPQILGVDADAFNKRNSFSFSLLLEGMNEKNPWNNLNHLVNNNLIPAFADQTVLTWGLKKSVGDTLFYLDEHGKQIGLLIIGALNNSVFQGNLLISDSLFAMHFPSVSGSRVMLVDGPKNKKVEIGELLSENLIDYGLEMSTTSSRLAEFNSVTNTYLSVFMALGGLGILIGTIGLGVILLRNMLGRISELAVLQSIGFNKKEIFGLIFKENFILLFSGILAGLLSATAGVLPALINKQSAFPYAFIGILILLIVLNGIASIFIPAKQIMNWNLIRNLQND
ncbi:MAG: ABC transporter permease [Bacteroidales bacterium]